MQGEPDLTAGARLMVRWMKEPRIDVTDLGFAIDLWMAVTGHVADVDDPRYPEVMMQAMSLAMDLADPPEPDPVVTVEFIEGEVL